MSLNFNGINIGGAPDTPADINIKTYNVQGEFVSSDGDTVKGTGNAYVKLFPNGLAEIQYVFKYSASGTSADNFACGISASLLHSINNNIPAITPKSGGVCTVYNSSGQIDTNITAYAGSHTSYAGYWVLSRIMGADGAGGAYPAITCKANDYVIGTCYGTYTVE